MINSTLYLREMKKNIKMLLIFAVVITMYVAIIIGMYDPEMMKTLDGFAQMMPELMAAVGMVGGTNTLLGFMVSYLYGFILLVFPMVFSILVGNGLVAKYTDSGAMAVLVGSPIKRRTIVFTQLLVLLSGVVILTAYATVLEIIVAEGKFPGELVIADLLKLNLALLCLQLFIAGICFFASCLFSDTKNSIALGAGVPALMFVLQMLSNAGEKAEFVKYFTFFTLFDANGIVDGNASAFIGAAVLFAGAVVLYVLSGLIFCKKDMSL